MNQTTAFLKRHSLVIGTLLMFALTWPIDLANSGILPIQFPFIVYLFLGWGFVFSAVIMTGLTLGRDGVIALLKRYLQWRVGWRWYLAAFLMPPASIALAVYLHAAFTGTSPDFSTVMAYKIFGESAYLPLFILPFFLIDLVANGEEIGWRGYVLPRLQAKHGALTSTLILGVIWGFWHLPKFLSHWNVISFTWFMAHTVAVAVLYTWMYNGTKGSLLLVALFHAGSNTAGVFMPMANTVSSENMDSYMIYVLLEVVAAILVYSLSTTFSRKTQEKMGELGTAERYM
jgi:uncharacterized protein